MDRPDRPGGLAAARATPGRRRPGGIAPGGDVVAMAVWERSTQGPGVAPAAAPGEARLPEGEGPEGQVLAFVAPRLRGWLARQLPRSAAEAWLEVRLRAGQPPQVLTALGERWPALPDAPGQPAPLRCTSEDIDRTLQLVTRASVYAWEAELAHAYCTLPGGHRVGVAGRALVERGAVRGQKDFGSLCIRIARAVPGAARELAARCAGPDGLRPTLVYGPPGSGKTTVLRDFARILSNGSAALRLPPRRVVVVDERSELAACTGGVPQFDLGVRTDVLDAFPKAQGLALAVRALSPEVLVCDEVGGGDDAAALADASRCGVTVVASAHAACAADLWHRPALRAVLRTGAFAQAVRLGHDRRIQEVHPLGPPALAAVSAGPGGQAPHRHWAPGGEDP
jgi:stage III sporulation protein AA